MKDFNIAILGCGTVGGGVARIMLDMTDVLAQRTSRKLSLKKIVEISAQSAGKRFSIPANLFCGGGKDITPEEANAYIDEILSDKDIDLVVETIGGSNEFIENLAIRVLKSGKHLVTANKALLAEKGSRIFEAAKESGMTIGYEAAVCGSIPIIKTIRESFSGDEIIEVSGIMNGTSNYILSKMQKEGMEFSEALKLAQENGYAEADPTLDINGGDAGHKLTILLKLAFGVQINMSDLTIDGVENIKNSDIEFAEEIDSRIKLICFAKKLNGKLYATVCPMMVKNSNFLSDVDGATNAVRIMNRYGGKQILVGAGAGSSETASSIVADIVFASRYSDSMLKESSPAQSLEFTDARHFEFPYIITFETTDKPGITGIVATAVGKQNINIDTVSHNRHQSDRATFSIATMPCTREQVNNVIKNINSSHPGILLTEPKAIPILY